MLKTKKYPHTLFMGHLALEKLLKALVVKATKAHAPMTHSLPFLAEKSRINIPVTIMVKLREFMEFHFEARYPSEQKAFYNKCTKAYTTAKFREMKKVFQWLEKKL